jgi:hypothetical protein
LDSDAFVNRRGHPQAPSRSSKAEHPADNRKTQERYGLPIGGVLATDNAVITEGELAGNFGLIQTGDFVAQFVQSAAGAGGVSDLERAADLLARAFEEGIVCAGRFESLQIFINLMEDCRLWWSGRFHPKTRGLQEWVAIAKSAPIFSRNECLF